MESNSISIINLIFEAGFVVQLVMLILVFMSIYSWTIISAKKKILINSKSDIKNFNKMFNAEVDFEKIYKRIPKDIESRGSMEKIFSSGYEEFKQFKTKLAKDKIINLEMVYRKMNNTMNCEIEDLDNNLSVLAMIASSSPYIGLFGTVWGIMNSFIALSSVKQASISMVAPGVSEALIATAFGLFAAIPATIAYNRFVSQVENINNKYISFVEELFINFNKKK